MIFKITTENGSTLDFDTEKMTELTFGAGEDTFTISIIKL